MLPLPLSPPGKVKADSWLLHQARLLADNITKDMEKLSPDCRSEGDNRSGWLGGTGESWERGTYYVRGLVSLAYVLDDAELKAQAQKWIDWTLQSQTEDGCFGPYASDPEKFDYWALMPMLMALETYADATGDERVLPFLKKYFDWQYRNLKKNPLKDWAIARGGDNIFAVYWYMEKTGDRSYEKLCNLLFSQTQDWSKNYVDDAWNSSQHIVNIHESFKLYPIMYALTGEEKYLDIYYKGIENLFISCGRADGMSNGDELSRGIFATYGSETCAVAERMLSDEIALMLLRDPSIADHLEYITYNTLPQQLLPDGKGQVYFTVENQIDASLGAHGFTSDGGDRSVYGAPGGFPCCVHNYQMSWPMFISSMWMATSDKGLVAAAYGPCNVSAVVGDGTNITLTETTNYPYENTVKLTVSADKADTYPLYIRIPEWCDTAKAPIIKINGTVIEGEWTSGKYYRIEKQWLDGDTVEMEFPRKITLEYGDNNSVSVRYGGVLFAMALKEDTVSSTYNPYGWARSINRNAYTSYYITTKDKWNAVLTDIDFSAPENTFSLSMGEITSDMEYRQSDAPMKMTAVARLMPSWVRRSDNFASSVPACPVSAEKLDGEEFTVTLIPYAFTRMRITMIPWTGADVIHTPVLENGSFVYENVILSTDIRDNKDLCSTDMNCNIEFLGTASSDMTFSVSVNGGDIGTVTLKAGESKAVMAQVLSNSARNKIVLTPTDGTAIPEGFSVSLNIVELDRASMRYEAEDGKLSGGAHSMGSHVAGIDKTGDGFSIEITVPKDGTYTVRAFYCAALGDATHTLTLNGSSVGQLLYSKSDSGWGSFLASRYAEIKVELTAGDHVIALMRTDADTGFAEIDAIEIIN